ncbi:MAG: septal ring lytic transglycosylase RlpA family protein [Nitrospirae bacterium]|nr:septal ring lytic transglycosylase RlpA family protein [Nitrospirota bacterium]
MRISADISFRDSSPGAKLKLLFAACCLPLFLIACASARHETAPARSFTLPIERHSDKLDRKGQEQGFKGDSGYVVASWYGTDFHGKKTASGDVFDMYAMTCAHREYPFGTKLRVVNVANHKEAQCLVNDRGPFIAGRGLDLSYAAAKKIDLISSGTAPVFIETIGRDNSYIKNVTYGESGSVLTIQVGAFKDETNALRLKSSLDINYKDAYIIAVDIRGERFYRVRLGKYANKEDAVKIGNMLANEGYSVLITRFEQQI